MLDVDGEAPHLRQPASAFERLGGELWVAEFDGRIVGCVGFADHCGRIELRSLYVAAGLRRAGLGGRLVSLVEEAALARGIECVELWTDTRFADAHRLYERLGYERGPHARDLRDKSRSVEYFYSKRLARGSAGSQ